jgi:RNAse (barnase) inhibitor barstar
VTLQESWSTTGRHLARAAEELRPLGGLDAFDEYLAHNELELAADVLSELGNEHENLSTRFWQAMASAYENMKLTEKAKLCTFRVLEAERGFIEARLTLMPTSDGGRATPILTDYRPSWNLGNRTAAGDVELNDARVSLEDCAMLQPGGTAMVRLHPLFLDAWHHVSVGTQLPLHEGSRVFGQATVTRAALKFDVTANPRRPVLTIDGSRFHDLEGFYTEVSTHLIPGADWGRNLDAFNDILRGGFGTPEGGFTLRWVNAQTSRVALGYAETVCWLEKKKLRCHPQNLSSVEEDLQCARRGEGLTLFDILLEIIRTHGPWGAEQEDAVELELA